MSPVSPSNDPPLIYCIMNMDEQDIQDSWLMDLDRMLRDETSLPPTRSTVTLSSTRIPEPTAIVMDHLDRASDHRARELPAQQRLILFILFILYIHVP